MEREAVLVGVGREIRSRNAEEWRAELEGALPRIRSRLDFMDADHHRIRDLVVRRLGEGSASIPPAWIAEHLGLKLEDVEARLERLERGLFFLVRDGDGRVSWAFPFTADETPHRVHFGERPTWGA